MYPSQQGWYPPPPPPPPPSSDAAAIKAGLILLGLLFSLSFSCAVGAGSGVGGVLLALACFAAVGAITAAHLGRLHPRLRLGPYVSLVLIALGGAALCGGWMGRGERAATEQRRVLRERQEQQAAREAARHLATLRAQAATSIATARTKIAQSEQFYGAGQFEQAHQLAEEAINLTTPLTTLRPPIEDAQPTLVLAQRARDAAAPFQRLLAQIQDAETSVAQVAPPNWVTYDDHLQELATALSGAAGDPAVRFSERIQTALRSIERRRGHIRRLVATARREQAEQAALRVVCGTSPPTISPWDGELTGAERYVRRTAHDPDSIEVQNCTQPVLTRNLCWVSECSVRGTNGFGARVLNRMRFSVGANHVILGAETVD